MAARGGGIEVLVAGLQRQIAVSNTPTANALDATLLSRSTGQGVMEMAKRHTVGAYPIIKVFRVPRIVPR